MSQHIYDYAIVGSGLSGLAIAARLSQETSNIILLDSQEQAGGMNRPIPFPTGVINNGLRAIPDNELNRKALLFLEDLLGLKLIGETLHQPPVTFEEGQLREFVGFGDQSIEFYDQLRPFLTADRLQTKLEPYAWPQLLFEKFKGHFQPRSYVTRFHIEDETVNQITINGAKTIRAANVIYTGPLKSLATLLSSDVLSARAKAKISKNITWTALCLDLCHSSPVTESQALHVLNGTTQDEIGPSVGLFLPVNEGKQTSQWMTYLDEEVTEDSEIVGAALKKMKRQIKRAYPEALTEIVRERIMIAPAIAGGEIKLNADQSLPEVKNLWMASATLSPERGLAGALLQAHLVLASLGFADSHATQKTEMPAEAL